MGGFLAKAKLACQTRVATALSNHWSAGEAAAMHQSVKRALIG